MKRPEFLFYCPFCGVYLETITKIDKAKKTYCKDCSDKVNRNGTFKDAFTHCNLCGLPLPPTTHPQVAVHESCWELYVRRVKEHRHYCRSLMASKGEVTYDDED